MEKVAAQNYKKGLWIFLGFFIVFLVINVIVGKYFYEFAIYHEILDILIPVLLYLKVTRKPVLSTLKLDKKLSKQSILIIFQLFLISFLLKFGINYLVLLTGKIDPGEVTTKVIDMVPNLFTFFIAVAVIPVFLEEFIIRGIVLDNFKETTLWQGSIITGLLFGFMHVDLGQFGYTTALGVIMAGIVICTGSLWGSILFHFFNNFLTFVFIAFFQLIEKFIPIDLLSEVDTTEVVIQNNLVQIIYGVVFAIASLGIGIFLTIHFIKKLQKLNVSNEKLMQGDSGEEVTAREECEEVHEKRVLWKDLFFNVPFFLIVILYIGINILLAS